MKTKSTASDDEREEKALKDRERARVWPAATTLREKYVNFVVPRTFTEKEMGLAYQTTAAAAWREGLCVIAGPKDGAWHPAQNVAPRALARSPEPGDTKCLPIIGEQADLSNSRAQVNMSEAG